MGGEPSFVKHTAFSLSGVYDYNRGSFMGSNYWLFFRLGQNDYFISGVPGVLSSFVKRRKFSVSGAYHKVIGQAGHPGCGDKQLWSDRQCHIQQAPVLVGGRGV
ncbi:hypothetical protein E2C01_050162 [Portunus trituberculatus]|uniref:Uncharacterized protein n=1 Tax=Portunus trituberculatus TaxID=210409 RepID=A0A5B7GGJ1_PORTR|nr:hypothetical protein [Portunus trituberculatus]